MQLQQLQVQHFFLRAGFGQPLGIIQSHIGSTPEALFEWQAAQTPKINPVKVQTDFITPGEFRKMKGKQRQQMAKMGVEAAKELNILWIKEMVTSSAQLREKMAFFWHDHFACQSRNPQFLQGYLDTLRNHALGNFGELLMEVSKSPAMLQYLNNQQNKKSSPNENFAREVMELFTLGRGQGYTERDVSEAARAFTGWAFDWDGKFVVRRFQHDEGVKTVLGKTGNFDGEDVIRILLSRRQTARYLSQKWVRFFVNGQGNEALEEKVANVLFENNYEILPALQVLFTSSEFYEEQNLAILIKSPVELIASLQRQLHVQIVHAPSLLYLQKTMGQVLFDPPNVAGWPSGKDWVDSATLIFRMNLPQLVFKAALIQNQPESFDDNDEFQLRNRLKKIETTLDTQAMSKSFHNRGFASMSAFLLQTKSNTEDPGGDYIDQIISLTSKPEYQLC